MAKRYLDPKADLTFKKVFGEHPDLVISLLNALLPFQTKEEEIQSVDQHHGREADARMGIRHSCVNDLQGKFQGRIRFQQLYLQGHRPLYNHWLQHVIL